jgi:hypothetical protein
MIIFKNVALGKMFGPKWEEVTDRRESATVKFVLVKCYWGDELSCVRGACEGGKKFIQNFDEETSWKETTWNSKVQMAG